MFSGDFLYPAAGWEDLFSPPGGLYAAQPGTDMYAYLEAMLKASPHLLLTSCCVGLCCARPSW